MNEEPTGNARAVSQHFEPIVRMTNTYIEPRDWTKEDMIREIENGYYVISSRGGMTNLDMFTFSAGEAYRIVDGEIGERVRDLTLTGNVFETMKNIDAIGNDLVIFGKGGRGGCGKNGQFPMPVGLGGPHIRIRNVIVGGANMLKQLFEKASKAADQVEIYSVKVEKYPVNFTANKLKSIKSQLTRGTGLRIIKNGRLGFSSDTGTSNQENLIKRALASVKLGPPAKFDFCRDKDLTRVDLFDPRTVSFEIEEAVEMGQKMIDHVVKHDPDTVNEASVTRYFIEVTYISDGVEKTYYKTLLTRGIYSMKITGDGFIYVGQSDSSCRLPDDILALSRRIVRKLPYTEKVFQMPSNLPA